MQVTDARKMSAAEIAALMKKKAFDEVELSPRIQAGTDAMFGRHMTAAQVVDQIVADVRKNGDESLFYYTKLIDRVELTPENIRVTEEEFAEAEAIVKPEVKAALERAIANVMKFHEEQMPKTWLTNRPYGSLLGQKVTPVDSVGIYVPGGTAAYPSSVMMNACPAKVAGVPRIVMAVPPGKDGKVNPNVLVTAKLIGVTEIYKMGGAQAIAALAYGTESIPKVDKIVGPGNIFVALAKRTVFGHVSIDSVAGPSEILVLADETANPRYVILTFLLPRFIASIVMPPICEQTSRAKTFCSINTLTFEINLSFFLNGNLAVLIETYIAITLTSKVSNDRIPVKKPLFSLHQIIIFSTVPSSLSKTKIISSNID